MGGELEGGEWNEAPLPLGKRGALLKVGGEKGANPNDDVCVGGLLDPLKLCGRPNDPAEALRDAPPPPAPLAPPGPAPTPNCCCPYP